MAENYHLARMTKTNTQSNQLIQQIADGDVEAFHKLFSLYGTRMFAFARRLVGDESIADDIVQESLIVVWQSAHKYRGQGRLISWLLGIVNNKARRIYRQRKHESLDAIQDTLHQGQFTEEVFDQDEEHRKMHEKINALSVEHQAVLDLVFFHNLTLKETADVLHCPVGTVKSRLNYAKKALRGVYLRENQQEGK